MMLNRDNYEMYFLLYIDNELDAAQREEVESFIQQHPDLAIELADLQNTLLTEEDSAAFPDKTMLYRQADKETELLLYIDDELNTAAKENLEKEIEFSPALQHQLQQLQQAVLSHENIAFENKESLYRYERRRIIAMSPFIRRSLTAAAVMAAVAISGWWLFNGSNSDVTQPGQAFNKPSSSNLPSSSAPNPGSAIQRIITDSSSQTTATSKPEGVDKEQKDPDQEHTSTAQPTVPVIAGVNKPAGTSARQKPASAASTATPIIASATRTGSSGTQPTGTPIVKATIANTGSAVLRPSRTTVAANIKPGQESSLITAPTTADEQSSSAANTIIARSTPARPGTSGNISEAPDHAELPEQSSTATLAGMPHTTPAAGATVKPAVYKELDVTEGNESLYIGNLELNKNKLAGIFKRAGRLFGKQSR